MKTTYSKASDLSDLVFQSAADFFPKESEDAARYWASRGIDPAYINEVHWADHIASLVARSKPASVLEFGSNWGRNLKAIQEKSPKTRLIGFDINMDAVNLGRKRGYDVRVGNEHSLGEIESSSYDIVFTVSVLDHLPDPRLALSELIRIARNQVILLEPWLGHEGKVIRGPNPETTELEDVESYAYSWDYVRLVSEVAPQCTVSFYPYDLGAGYMRRWLSSSYNIYIIGNLVNDH